MMKLIIFGNVPSKSNCYKIITLPNGKGGTRPSLAKRKALVQYEKSFSAQITSKQRLKLNCDLQISMTVYFDSRRPDLDGAFKALLDCLQTNEVIVNDRQVKRLVAEKRLDKENPRVEFMICEFLNPEQPLLLAPTREEANEWLAVNAPQWVRDTLL